MTMKNNYWEHKGERVKMDQESVEKGKENVDRNDAPW
jgi:hypothetical protein